MNARERAACALLLSWCVLAVLTAIIQPAANAIVLERLFEKPSVSAPFGRDELGRSIAVRVALGAKYSLGIGLVVVTASATLGIALGVIGGWLGGAWNFMLGRLIEVLQAFPGILLAIALASVLGPGLGNVTVALIAIGWVGFARLAQLQTASVKTRDHVAVARALGSRLAVVLGRHVLPLIAAPLIIEASFVFAAVIVAEAGLSFLGLGIQAPAPSWGSMIRDGMRCVLVAPHVVVAPCLALASVALAVNVLGEALRRRLAIEDVVME